MLNFYQKWGLVISGVREAAIELVPGQKALLSM